MSSYKKKLHSRINLLIAIVISSQLSGCTSLIQNKLAGIDHNHTFYGAWLLLNPQDMQENIINGGLIIGKENMSAKERTICKNNDYAMTFMERNFGYGCASYEVFGQLELNQTNHEWYLLSGSPDERYAKMRLELKGNELYAYLSQDKTLIFKRSSREAILNKGNLTCELTEQPADHDF